LVGFESRKSHYLLAANGEPEGDIYPESPFISEDSSPC
jgi:hypothetical protein